MPGDVDPSRREGGKPVVFIAIVLGLILGIGGAGGYWLYKNKFANPVTTTTTDVAQTTIPPTQTPPVEQPPPAPNPDTQPPAQQPPPADTTPATPPAAEPNNPPPPVVTTTPSKPAPSQPRTPPAQQQHTYTPPSIQQPQPQAQPPRAEPQTQTPPPVAEPVHQPPPPVQQPRNVEPPPQAQPSIAQPEPQRRPMNPSPPDLAPYNGPRSGVLTYSGPPVVQNGEVVFEGLPPGQVVLSYDLKKWEGRFAPGRNNTQRLILRSIKAGSQKECVVRWHL